MTHKRKNVCFEWRYYCTWNDSATYTVYSVFSTWIQQIRKLGELEHGNLKWGGGGGGGGRGEAEGIFLSRLADNPSRAHTHCVNITLVSSYAPLSERWGNTRLAGFLGCNLETFQNGFLIQNNLSDTTVLYFYRDWVSKGEGRDQNLSEVISDQ